MLEVGYAPLHRGFRFKQIQTHELSAIRDALAEYLKAAHLNTIKTQKQLLDGAMGAMSRLMTERHESMHRAGELRGRGLGHRQANPDGHLGTPVRGAAANSSWITRQAASNMQQDTHTNPGAACWNDTDGFSRLRASKARSL
jgi:hypothetical protein